MTVKFKNNAIGYLSSAISSSDTSAALTSGGGASFPTVGAGEYFYATITSTSGAFEIIKVTSRSTDTLGIARAQEGTSAIGFPSGSIVELRITAQGITDAINDSALSSAFIALTSANTLTSQTAAQAIFDGGGGPTNGAITLSTGVYFFECGFSLTNMSSSSGSFGFALGGSATITQSWRSSTAKPAALATATAAEQTFNTAANTTLITANTNTVGMTYINGVIRITSAGTIIPQVSLGVASAAVVGVNSYFKSYRAGDSSVVSLGDWG
jgi:hypothetical protein